MARAGVVSGVALLALLSFLGLQNAVPVLGVMAAPPGLGTPPYRTEFPREMTLSVTLALARFPDVPSCLTADTGGDLTRMDWDRIETRAEAEVCLFRLLVSNGDMARAADLLQEQGFTVSTAPIELEDRQYLQASWSIRALGPQFPTHGWARYGAAVPYGMGVNTVWDPTGQNLLGVGLNFAVE